LLPFWYKNLARVNNIIKQLKGANMSRKKKSKDKASNKVVKLTDEQYNDYVMALKEERPPLLVRKSQKQD
jgi:hypothetical protein